jgi:hypothetical protein
MEAVLFLFIFWVESKLLSQYLGIYGCYLRVVVTAFEVCLRADEQRIIHSGRGYLANPWILFHTRNEKSVAPPRAIERFSFPLPLSVVVKPSPTFLKTVQS